MFSPRDFLAAAPLASGKILFPGGGVLFTGGVGRAVLETAELYAP